MGISDLSIAHISRAGIDAGLNRVEGSRSLQLAIATIANTLSRADGRVLYPKLGSTTVGISKTGASTVQCGGARLLQKGRNVPLQAVASVVVFGTVTDFVTVFARFPGKLGNGILLTVATPGTAAVSESDLDTDAPKVEWTPEAGDVDASIAELNASSKLVYAVKSGTGGTLAAAAEQALAGGEGPGCRYHVGKKIIQDTTAYGTSFAGSVNGSHIALHNDDFVSFRTSHLDIVAGEALPTGATAPTAVQGLVRLGVEWVNPRILEQIDALVIA